MTLPMPKIFEGFLPVIGGAFLFSLVLVGIFPDLGLNLVAETIGVAFTVFIIDELIRRRDRERMAPLLTVAAKDARQIASRIERLLLALLETTLLPSEVDLLAPGTRLSADTLMPAFNRVVLTGLVNVVSSARPPPNLDYWVVGRWIAQEGRECAAALQTFAERYNSVIEPELAAALDKLENTALIKIAKMSLTTGHIHGQIFQSAAEAAESVHLALSTAGLTDGSPPSFDDRFRAMRESVIAHPVADAAAPYRPVSIY